MTSGFHPSELLKSVSNYPVAKGDLPGHAFHGNQYTEGSGGSASLSNRASELHDNVPDYSGVSNAVSHNRLAADHTALAEKLRRDGHDDAANAHDAAARAHNTASAAHARVAVIENRGRARGNGPTMSKALKEARDRSSVAAGVSQRADVFTREINNAVTKGDVAGHEFHGNQWTGGTVRQVHDHVKVANALADRAREIRDDAYEYSQGNGIDRFAKEDYADAHDRLADDHRAAAKNAKADGMTDLVKAHIDAAKAHDTAAENFLRQKPQSIGERAGRFTAPQQDASAASQRAIKEAIAYS